MASKKPWVSLVMSISWYDKSYTGVILTSRLISARWKYKGSVGLSPQSYVTTPGFRLGSNQCSWSSKIAQLKISRVSLSEGITLRSDVIWKGSASKPNILHYSPYGGWCRSLEICPSLTFRCPSNGMIIPKVVFFFFPLPSHPCLEPIVSTTYLPT